MRSESPCVTVCVCAHACVTARRVGRFQPDADLNQGERPASPPHSSSLLSEINIFCCGCSSHAPRGPLCLPEIKKCVREEQIRAQSGLAEPRRCLSLSRLFSFTYLVHHVSFFKLMQLLANGRFSQTNSFSDAPLSAGFDFMTFSNVTLSF